MKERPLPFSASMVRAILYGSKTMTRRIIQPHLVSDSHWQPTEPVYWLDDDNSVPLWESIHGPGAWAANPWVWAIKFRKVEKNHKNCAATQPPSRNR